MDNGSDNRVVQGRRKVAMEGSLRNCLFTASMYFGFSVKHIVATLFIQTIFSLHKLH